MEIILWILFIIPGLIYSLWRLSSRGDVCSQCGQANLIPLNTPVARQFMAKHNLSPVLEDEFQRQPSESIVAPAKKLGRFFGRLDLSVPMVVMTSISLLLLFTWSSAGAPIIVRIGLFSLVIFCGFSASRPVREKFFGEISPIVLALAALISLIGLGALT